MVKEATYEVRKAGLTAKAKITHTETRLASEIYGKKAKLPDKMMIEVYGKIDEWEGRIGTIPKPTSKYVSPKTKMSKFLEKYKKPPEAGMMVDVIANQKGYWTLDLPH